MFESLSSIFGAKKNSNNSNATKKPAESDISVRSPEDVKGLEQLVKTGPVTFVLVHADWCGPCQSYKPLWSELERSPGRKANMAMIHHDMVDHAPILKKAKIPGFPSVLKVYPDGKIEEYKEDSQKTNAVPNIRDKETMLAQLRSPNIKTFLNINKNSSNKPVIKDTMGLSPTPVTETIGPSRQITISPKQLERNARSLKSMQINYSGLKPLNNSHPVSVNSRPIVIPKTIPPRKLPKSLRLPSRSMSPMQPMQPIQMSQIPQMPQMQPMPMGRRQTPIMTGGALYSALAGALTKAGPASLLFAASQMLPTKKNTGSSKRLTRRVSRNSVNSRRSRR